jgi:hypothetical protein
MRSRLRYYSLKKSFCVPVMPLLVLLFLSYRYAFAGPPFFTDDPEPVKHKHWEFYIATQHLHDVEGWSGTAPHAEVNYGIAPNMQLHVIAPRVYSKPEDSPQKAGYGDTEAGLKLRFIQETKARPQVGVFPLVEFHTGNESKGLGSGNTRLFLPLWLQKSWGPWTSYGGGGYWINPGEGNRNWTFWGWELQRDISDKLMVGGELFYRTPDSVDAAHSNGFNLGGEWNFNEQHHLLFSAGRDIDGPNRFTVYLAFQWTYPN